MVACWRYICWVSRYCYDDTSATIIRGPTTVSSETRRAVGRGRRLGPKENTPIPKKEKECVECSGTRRWRRRRGCTLGSRTWRACCTRCCRCTPSSTRPCERARTSKPSLKSSSRWCAAPLLFRSCDSHRATRFLATESEHVASFASFELIRGCNALYCTLPDRGEVGLLRGCEFVVLYSLA